MCGYITHQINAAHKRDWQRRHVWLVDEYGIVIDITGDQFAGKLLPEEDVDMVYVGQEGPVQEMFCKDRMLTINNLKFHILAVRIVNRDYTAKEVAFALHFDNLLEVIEKLLAVFCFPIVIALINRDHKTFIRSLHERNQFGFGTFQQTSLRSGQILRYEGFVKL